MQQVPHVGPTYRLGITLQNLVIVVTWHQGFVHPRSLVSQNLYLTQNLPFKGVHLNIFSQHHENIQRNSVYPYSFLNYAINIIFGQIHVLSTLLPGKNPLNKCV